MYLCIRDRHINYFMLFRMYALRKVRHEFKENKMLENMEEIQQCYTKGQEALQMIKRQVTLGNLYGTRPLVIETKSKLQDASK